MIAAGESAGRQDLGLKEVSVDIAPLGNVHGHEVGFLISQTSRPLRSAVLGVGDKPPNRSEVPSGHSRSTLSRIASGGSSRSTVPGADAVPKRRRLENRRSPRGSR